MNATIPLGFVYDCRIFDAAGRLTDAFTEYNLIPQVGINHIAGLIRGSTSLISNWYLGIYEGNYVPTSGVTAADLPSTVLECQAYSGATRPAWSHVFDGTSVIDNVASLAEFVFTADKTIYGGFLVSNSTKGGNTGTLLSIARFSSPRVVQSGGRLEAAAGITLIPTTSI